MRDWYEILRSSVMLVIIVAVLIILSSLVMIPSESDSEPTTQHYFVRFHTFDVEYTEDDIISYPVGPFRSMSLFLCSYYFDTPNDPAVKKLYAAIEPLLTGLTDHEKAEYLNAFVFNNIRYVTDETKHGSEYIQFASETILSGTGDCEDFSILLYNLYRLAGLDSVLVSTQNHVLVAVDDSGYGDTIAPLLSIKQYTYADPANYRNIGKGLIDGFTVACHPSIFIVCAFLILLGSAEYMIYRMED